MRLHINSIQDKIYLTKFRSTLLSLVCNKPSRLCNFIFAVCLSSDFQLVYFAETKQLPTIETI